MEQVNTMEWNKIIDTFYHGKDCKYGELQEYHKDWNLLMPAYKKFRSLTGMKMPEWLSHCNSIENWIVRVCITEAHKYLVEAILWYNSLTDKKEV